MQNPAFKRFLSEGLENSPFLIKNGHGSNNTSNEKAWVLLSIKLLCGLGKSLPLNPLFKKILVYDLLIGLAHGIFALHCSMHDLIFACGIKFPDQESNLGPLHSEHEVLTSGPPGKAESALFRCLLPTLLHRVNGS